MSLMYGVTAIILAFGFHFFGSSIGGFAFVVMALVISLVAPIGVWFMVIRIQLESPAKPGKVAGASAGAAIFTGLWLLFIKSLC
jgi:hypothetical protein